MVKVEAGEEQEFRYLAAWLAASEALDRLIEATETATEEPPDRETYQILSAAASAASSSAVPSMRRQ